ncbi:CHRNN [Lepeophtheirus salmonis]|uniref:CHRNN n=1 Tax=Lepeophtheirus salmonis TaxID=72036 RepID=A0A7R8D374_LEPSM|nr:CHRNN [Lepeophtheirus salmonis]CAF3008220.1 CHRNN [Lepeophtheirus salmonis]
MLFILIFLSFFYNPSNGNPDAKRLYDDLLSNYNRLIRPVSNHTEKVTVKLGLRLSQLVDLNLKDQILTTNVWLEHEWKDYKFTWDPSEYGGVTEIYVPSEHIWLPDIILYNNADGDYIVTTMTKAILHYDGKVVWTPPAIFKSSCEIDVEFFPFDKQTCFLKFGSWSFDGFQVDLVHINSQPDNDTVSYGMDLSDIIIRRKPLFLRRKSNHSLCWNFLFVDFGVLFACSVWGKDSPCHSYSRVSNFVLYSCHRSHPSYFENTSPSWKVSHIQMPQWVRRTFIQRLPRILLMRVPIQVIKDTMKTRRSKYLRQSDPALKSLAGKYGEDDDEEDDAKGNGGLNSQLRGHLNGLYRGLTKIMTSTCDVMDVKSSTSPFAIEKAVHNIMFIKHHMKRQDEFDAEDQDWGIVAMVLDRLFLWVFGISALVGSIMILVESPNMYEEVSPIDVIFSKIALEESSRVSQEKVFM